MRREMTATSGQFAIHFTPSVRCLPALLMKSAGFPISSAGLSLDGYSSMKITVTAMGVMQMPIDQVVYMVAMWNLLMPAGRAMDMGAVMPGTSMGGRALRGVRSTDL